MQIRKRVAGVAIAASLLGSVLGAPAAVAGGGGPYYATCASSGNSRFENDSSRTRSFGYVWRVGTTVLGSGTVRLAPAQAFTAPTPGGATKFGVVKAGSTTYAYVDCI